MQPCCEEWDGKKEKPLEEPTKGMTIILLLLCFIGDVVGSLDNSLIILHEIIPSVASKRVHMTKKHVLIG